MAGWAWGSVADQKLGALLNTPMKALEDYLRRLERYFPTAQYTKQTTDGSAATAATLAMSVDRTTYVECVIVARRTGGSAGSSNDGAAYRLEFAAKNAAGTATLLAAATKTVIGESQAGWDVSATASGGDVLVQVTGAANNTVAWHVVVRRYAVRGLNEN
jgi:hypothetical protein